MLWSKLTNVMNSSLTFLPQEADSDGNGTLDLEEFKDVITNLFHFKFKVRNIHRQLIISSCSF